MNILNIVQKPIIVDPLSLSLSNESESPSKSKRSSKNKRKSVSPSNNKVMKKTPQKDFSPMKDDTKAKIMSAIKLAKEGLELVQSNPKEAIKRFEDSGKG